MNKPPLGLKPRKIFLEERLLDIKQAMQMYYEVKKEIPVIWIEEYNMICRELNPDVDVSRIKMPNIDFGKIPTNISLPRGYI